MIFLLIIWEFNMMNPTHTHFLVVPCLPPHPWEPPPSLKEEEEEKGKRNLTCVLHVLTGTWATSGVQPRKEKAVAVPSSGHQEQGGEQQPA